MTPAAFRKEMENLIEAVAAHRNRDAATHATNIEVAYRRALTPPPRKRIKTTPPVADLSYNIARGKNHV